MTGNDESTSGLLEFARGASDGELKFDGADVSSDGLGESTEGQSWWNAERSGLVLRGRKMLQASLLHANLANADLGAADLTGMRGIGVRLERACLEGALLEGADLIGANLHEVSAGEANFAGAMLEDADLSGGRFRFAKFTDAILDGANLSSADLWGAHLGGVAAERCNLSGCRLDEAFLAKADFNSGDFSGATLRKANLADAKLRNANLRGAVLDGADLTHADLSGAELPNVVLASCKLGHAKFAGAWLDRTRMRADQLGGRVGEEAAGELEAALDSYIVLERNFISLGNAEDASWAFRRRRRVGKRLFARQALAGLRSRQWAAAAVPGTRWLGDVAAEWLCDYGESVGRVLRAFVTILFLFALVYWVTGSLHAREGFAPSSRYAVINYLLFSLNSMTTVGTSEVPLRPAGELGVALSSLQTVLGTTLLGLFGFVLGARIRG